MIHTLKKHLFCLLLLLSGRMVNAQLSGTYNIPTNYPTLASAVSALNTLGVSGAVTINIPAGYTETAPLGGYVLTATGSALNTITFRKTGVGANPLISAYAGGTGIPSSATQDGIWRFVGSDYVVVDGIDLLDPNLTNPSTMEFGFGFFKATTSNACQNNLIQNCVITLNRINNAVGAGPSVDGSRAINVVNALNTSQATALTPVSAAGSNSNNRFYSNTIQNCNIGISIIGYAAPSPFTLADTDNDIGGTLSVNGNTIVNYGGATAATNPAAAIRTLAQYNLNVANNVINNNTGSGVNHVTTLRGIYLNTATSANATIINNTLTLNSSATTAPAYVIENVSGATASNNTVTINNNVITNTTHTTNTSGSFIGIYNNAASAAYLFITGNTFSGINSRSTTGANYLIYNTGAVTTAITITNNLISNCTNTSTGTGAYYSIFNNVVSTAALNMSNNTFTNTSAYASTGATYLIYNASSTNNSISISNNLISNTTYSISSNGVFYGLYNAGTSTANLSVNSNTFTNHTINGFNGVVYLMYNTGAIANSISFVNNQITACSNSFASTGTYYGVFNNVAPSASLSMDGNVFSGSAYAATTGSVILVLNRGAISNTFTNVSFDNNLISNCSFSASSTAPFIGIANHGVTCSNLSMSSNTISTNAWLTTTSARFFVHNTGPVTNTINLNTNLFTNLTFTNNTTGTLNGILNTGQCTVAINACGNTFSNVVNRATSGGAYYVFNSGTMSGGIITMTNNLITNCTNSATGTADFYAIQNQGISFSSLLMSNNTFTNNTFAAATGATNLLYNAGAVSTSINSIAINNNFIASSTVSVSSSGAFYGIYNNNASCASLDITANTFTNNINYAANGAVHMVYNRGTITNTVGIITIAGNLISNQTNSATTNAPFYSIWNNGVSSGTTAIINNTLTNTTWATTSGLRYLISNWGVGTGLIKLSNNVISNCTSTNNTTGFLFGIYNNNNTTVSSGALSVKDNTFTNNVSSATTGETHYINCSGLVTNTFASIDVSDNLFESTSNSITSTGPFYGIYNNTASTNSLTINTNTFSNNFLSSANGAVHFIHNRGVAGSLFSSVSVNNNLFSSNTSSVSSNGSFFGVLVSGAATSSCSTMTIANNTFTNNSSLVSTGQIALISNGCPVTNSLAITNNQFINYTNTLTTTGNFFAINNNGNSSSGNLTVDNNLFSNLVSSASSGTRYLIYNNGGIANVASMSSNTIINCTHSISLGGAQYGIYNNSNSSGNGLTLSNNTFTNNVTTSGSGNVYAMVNAGALSSTITNVTFSNNLVANYTTTAVNGNFFAVNNAGFTSVNLSIGTNTINNILAQAPARTQQLISNSGRVTGAISIEDNLISNYTSTINTSGSFFGIYNNIAYANGTFPSTLTINNNSFLNAALNSSTAPIYFINNTGVATNTISNCVISNNLITNNTDTIKGNTSFYGIYNATIAFGDLSVNSNTLSNVVVTSTLAGRYGLYNAGLIVNSVTFTNNRITNLTSTVNTTGPFYGIGNFGASQGDLLFSGNSLSNINLGSTSGASYMYFNSGIITNSINIANNLISNVSHSASTSGPFVGIFNNAGSSVFLNIGSNSFTNVALYSASGAAQMIYNNRAVASATIGTINITNNTAGSFTFTSASGPFYGILTNLTTYTTLNVSANSFSNAVLSTTTGARYCVYNTGVGLGAMNVVSNLFSNFVSNLNTTGSYYGINNAGNITGSLTYSNNSILNHTLSATTGSVFSFYNSGVVSNSINIANNLLSSLSHSASTSGGFQGIFNNAGSSAQLQISSNTFTNISLYTQTGATQFIYNRAATAGTVNAITIANNILGALSFSASSGPFFGIYNNGIAFANLSIGSNSFVNVGSNSSTSARYFIYNTGAGASSIGINTNLVSNYTSSVNTTGLFYDVLNTGACAGNLDINGNVFSNHILPATTASLYVINNSGAITNSVSISSNSVSNLSYTSTTGFFYGIFQNSSSAGNISINSNTLTTIDIVNSVSPKYCIYNTSNSGNATSLSNNNIAAISNSVNTTGNFFGIYNTGNVASNFVASTNTFDDLNLASSTATTYVLYNTGSNSGAAGGTTMDGNVVSDIVRSSSSGPFFGLYNSAASSGSISLSSNSFTNCVLTATAAPVYIVYNTGASSSDIRLSNNEIANVTNSLNTSSSFYGVYNSGNSSGKLDVNSNVLANSLFEITTGTTCLVYNSAASSNSISMNSNTINACVTTSAISSNYYGIYNSGASATTLSMSLNSFVGNTSDIATGNTHLIFNSGNPAGLIAISNNTLGYGYTNVGTDYSGTLYGIYNTGGALTTSLTISGNNFSSFPFSGAAGTGSVFFINNSNNNSNLDVTGNSWTNLSLNHIGNQHLIYNASSTQASLSVNNNSIITAYTRTGIAGSFYGYYSTGSSPSTCSQVFSGNVFSNINAATQGAGAFYGFYSLDGLSAPYPKKSVFNNTIANVNYNGLGFMYAYYFDFLGDGGTGSGSTIYNNTVTAVNWAGPFYGLVIGNNVTPNFAATIYSNTVYSINSSGTAINMYGSHLSGAGAGVNFYKNKISDLTANGNMASASGLYVSAGVNSNVFNNLIGNIYTPSSSATNALNGITVAGGSQVNLYYNTVYLTGTSTGSNFNANALFAASSVNLSLRNNILINDCNPTGTGMATAYRRSTSSLSTFSSTSNNNVFYAGIPASNHVVFHDGSTAYITLPSYQALVAPRDNASFFEKTPFINTTGNSINFLHVDPALASSTESGALAITTFTDDVDGQIRQGNPGYLGAGTAPDIGADEYNQNLLPCSSINAGTITVPVSSVKCAGETVYMLSTGYTAGGGVQHQWKVSSSSGGPYSNVVGGTGANNVTYNSATLSPGTYYYILESTCIAGSSLDVSNEVTVTVNPAPSASIAVSSQTLCSGETLSLTGSSDIGTNYSWVGPGSFTSSVQNPLISDVPTTASGNYSLMVSTSNCTANTIVANVTINTSPPVFSLTPGVSSICIGSSQTIAASVPITSPTLNFGSQTNQNSSSGYPAPYSVYYGGQKMQMLILAGELSAAGFTVGSPINSIQFPVVSLGANWGGSLNACKGFMVGVKATTLSLLSSFETGVLNVVSATDYTPSIGFGNIHNFSSPFIWDGSSNLIIETVFSNNTIGTAANTVIQYNSPTGFQSTVVYRADNQTASAIAAATNSNVNVGFVRPDFRLNGTQVGTYSWGPSSGLSAIGSASALASPTVSTVYTATLSNGQCSSNASMSLSVMMVPTVNIASTSSNVCLGNTATLTASGATTYTWNTNTSGSVIVVAPFVSTTYTVTGSNPTCPNSSTVITIASSPALTLVTQASPAAICSGDSTTLSVSGANTYLWNGGANTSSIVVTPSISTNYVVTGNDGPGCWASKTVFVKVNALPTISITPQSATVCLGESVTFEASGAISFTWLPGNSNSPIFAVSPLTSVEYTVAGVDLNNCSNTASVSVTIDPCTILQDVSITTKRVSLFPNPSSGIFNMEFEFDGEKQIKVINSLGTLIREMRVDTHSEVLDLSKFAKGIYYVKIQSGDFFVNYKLILN